MAFFVKLIYIYIYIYIYNCHLTSQSFLISFINNYHPLSLLPIFATYLCSKNFEQFVLDANFEFMIESNFFAAPDLISNIYYHLTSVQALSVS